MTTLAQALAARLGAAHVTEDAGERRYLSTDIAGGGAVAAVVAAPGTVAELRDAVRLAAEAGASIVARGGGMSYTGGYVPADDSALLLDLRRLDRVAEISAEDRYVVVEVGCSFGALHAALETHGLRLASFGPLSGSVATIGGGLSQHAMFFGAGRHGGVAGAVLGLEVVLADGSLLATGALARAVQTPFFRDIAPDLTGMFLGDAGAFGVKARAALRVIPAPAAQGHASFGFADHPALARAQLAVAALEIAAESYGFDRVTNAHLKQLGFSVGESLELAGEMARNSRGARDAVAAVWQAARGRVQAGDTPDFTLHVTVEAESAGAVDSALARIRMAAGGRALADTIPRVTRARPFRRIRAMLGPSGQNWLPLHGIVPVSAALPALAAVMDFLAGQAEEFVRHRIEVAILTSAGAGWFLIEPQFFWYDALGPMLERAVLPEQRERFAARPPDPTARAVVHRCRAALCEVLDQAGAVHLQLGKYYGLQDRLQPASLAMLGALKRLFDPRNLMNPGALGLP